MLWISRPTGLRSGEGLQQLFAARRRLSVYVITQQHSTLLELLDEMRGCKNYLYELGCGVWLIPLHPTTHVIEAWITPKIRKWHTAVLNELFGART